jgi:hypothetical protein
MDGVTVELILSKGAGITPLDEESLQEIYDQNPEPSEADQEESQ